MRSRTAVSSPQHAFAPRCASRHFPLLPLTARRGNPLASVAAADEQMRPAQLPLWSRDLARRAE